MHAGVCMSAGVSAPHGWDYFQALLFGKDCYIRNKQ